MTAGESGEPSGDSRASEALQAYSVVSRGLGDKTCFGARVELPGEEALEFEGRGGGGRGVELCEVLSVCGEVGSGSGVVRAVGRDELKHFSSRGGKAKVC